MSQAELDRSLNLLTEDQVKTFISVKSLCKTYKVQSRSIINIFENDYIECYCFCCRSECAISYDILKNNVEIVLELMVDAGMVEKK